MILLKSLGITTGIAVLFYRSAWAILIFPIVYFILQKEAKIRDEEEKRGRLLEQFLHGIGILNSSLQAGLSMENAWKEVEKETKLLYGSRAEFFLEVHEINERAAHNIPIEKLFLEFAYRCKLEEMIEFAELMEFGKRSGGNWKKIISMTVEKITERQDVKQQIEVMVAQKKMEQQIMNIAPIGLLAFLQFSAWDYMSVLYHNVFGFLCMTIFLLGYVGAVILSQNILKVQV